MNYHRNFLMHPNLKWRCTMPIIFQMIQVSPSQQSHISRQNVGGSLVNQSQAESLRQFKSFVQSSQTPIQEVAQLQEKGDLFHSIVSSIEGQPQLKAKLLLQHMKEKAKIVKEKAKLAKISHERQKTHLQAAKTLLQREKTALRTQTLKLLRTMNLQSYSLQQVGRYLNNQTEPIIKTIEYHKQNPTSPVSASLHSHSEKKEKPIKKAKKYMNANQHIFIQQQLSNGLSIKDAAIRYGLTERQIRNIKRKCIKAPRN